MAKTESPKNSRLAVSALVTAVLCIPLVPVVLGVLGLVGIKRSNGVKKGLGFAIAGIVVGLALILFLLVSLIPPPLEIVRVNSDLTKNVNNMKNITLALRNYSSDWDGKFPDSLDDLLPEYVDIKEAFLFRSHKKKEQGIRYIYFKGVTDASPNDTAVFKTPFPVSKGKWLVAYKDGRVEEVSKQEADSLE